MSAERLLLLLSLLSRWQTRKELADGCGCSQREITRDLSDLGWHSTDKPLPRRAVVVLVPDAVDDSRFVPDTAHQWTLPREGSGRRGSGSAGRVRGDHEELLKSPGALTAYPTCG